MLFDDWNQIAKIAITTLMAYVAVIIVLRVTGKRTLSKLNAFDFVVTVALGSLLASTILTKAVSVADGLTAIAGLALLQLLVTWLSTRWQPFAKSLRSEPRLLLSDGRFHDDALCDERVTRDEVEAAIRKDGHGKVEEITAVVLESDGSLSVIVAGSASQCTALRSVKGSADT